VIGFLRFLGVANAAVWFGAAIFFTFAIGPAFFSDKMMALLGSGNAEIGRIFAGAAVQLVLERYYTLHHVCGLIAILHVVAEWLYMGKPLQRLTLWLLLGIFSLGVIGGYGLQPRLQGFHRIRYAPGSTLQQREQAKRSFNTLHAVSQVLNLIVTAGVLVYLWRVTVPANGYRYRT
jgi:hypothetical protein